MNPFRFLQRRRPAPKNIFRPTVVELETRFLPAVNVLSYHNDGGLTGQNLSETILTPANVNATDFGKLFTDPVDGAMYAQPLYMSGVSVPGMGSLNLVFVATENDSVYAFNADAPGPPVWHDGFTNAAAGVTTVSDADLNINSIAPVVGITGTPVIDAATNTLYVAAFTKEVTGSSTAFIQRLHALDVATGAEKFGGPVVIQVLSRVPAKEVLAESFRSMLFARISGRAWRSPTASFTSPGRRFKTTRPTTDGSWVITPKRCSKLLFSTTLPMVDWAASGKVAPPPRWTQRATFLSQPPAEPLTPTRQLRPTTITPRACSSLGQQGVAGSAFKDSFTPFNQATLVNRDEDIASGGLLLLPDQPGPFPHEMIAAGKQGKVYLINRDNMGGFDPAVDHVIQELPQVITSLFGTPAYFNGQVYLGGYGNPLQAFSLTNGQLSTTPVSQTSVVFGYPGTTPSISANGSSNGIVWAVERTNTAILHAYAANDLGIELYNSSQAINNRDQLAAAVKFEVPIIANGKVYVATQTGLTVFGLLPPGSPAPFGSAGAFVTQAFKDLLGRAPDTGGLAYWSTRINQGLLTRSTVALGIESSNEYRTLEVQQIYARFFHRPAEAGALNTWTSFLGTGGTVEQLDARIIGSGEYFQSHSNNNTGFLAGLFQDVLGRSLDPAAQSSFEAELGGGASPGQVAAQVVSSTEALQKVILGYYAEFLHRSADSAGLDSWVNDIHSGLTNEQVIAFFIGSQEYFDKL